MSHSLETTVTQKGQVTVPIEIRRRLGLKARDKVVFEMDGEVVRMRAVPKTDFRRGYRAVPPRQTPEDFVAIRERMEREIALDVTTETP